MMVVYILKITDFLYLEGMIWWTTSQLKKKLIKSAIASGHTIAMLKNDRIMIQEALYSTPTSYSMYDDAFLVFLAHVRMSKQWCRISFWAFCPGVPSVFTTIQSSLNISEETLMFSRKK